MMLLLDALTTVPAHVIDDRTTILVQNTLSRALLGPWTDRDARHANVAWRWFTHPESRALNSQRSTRRSAADTSPSYAQPPPAVAAIRSSTS
jgi:hypothetical protein